MKKILSKKEILMLKELANILLKYHAIIVCRKSGDVEVQVFEEDSHNENALNPIIFSQGIDEEVIEELFELNDRTIEALGLSKYRLKWFPIGQIWNSDHSFLKNRRSSSPK